ncbi:MAG: hypothetical protein ACYS0F_13065 [Planctomycetota bacterium]
MSNRRTNSKTRFFGRFSSRPCQLGKGSRGSSRVGLPGAPDENCRYFEQSKRRIQHKAAWHRKPKSDPLHGLRPAALQPEELTFILSFRWWTLKALLRDGPPREPFDTGV